MNTQDSAALAMVAEAAYADFKNVSTDDDVKKSLVNQGFSLTQAGDFSEGKGDAFIC